jgi:hypothetical protein
MRLRSRLLSILTITSTAAWTSCGGGNGTPYSYQNITISVSPHIASIPVNTSMTFTATVTNAPATSVLWNLDSSAYANEGSPMNQSGGATFVYTAPPTPPIYTGPGIANTQGTVTLSATFPILGMIISDNQTFVVTAPSVTVALSPATATVALNATQQFTGYAVGNVNNALTWQVNGVTGGSTTNGTIAPAVNALPGVYLYTAPSAIPMTGNTVTLTVISQADPTKTASSTITVAANPLSTGH